MTSERILDSLFSPGFSILVLPNTVDMSYQNSMKACSHLRMHSAQAQQDVEHTSPGAFEAGKRTSKVFAAAGQGMVGEAASQGAVLAIWDWLGQGLVKHSSAMTCQTSQFAS